MHLTAESIETGDFRGTEIVVASHLSFVSRIGWRSDANDDHFRHVLACASGSQRGRELEQQTAIGHPKNRKRFIRLAIGWWQRDLDLMLPWIVFCAHSPARLNGDTRR